MSQTVILQTFYKLFTNFLQAARIFLKIKMIPFTFQKVAFQAPICRLLERKRRHIAS